MTSFAPTELSVSPADRWQLARATASFQVLLTWDYAWTGAAESAEPLSGDGARLLPVLAAEVQRGIGEAHEAAVWLHDYVLTAGPGLLSELVAVQAKTARDDAQEEFADLLTQFGENVGQLIEDGYRNFVEAEADEQRSLSEQLSTLLRGGGAGDLSRKMLCSVADLTVVAGLVTAVIPPHAHAAAIIAAGAAARKIWKCAEFG